MSNINEKETAEAGQNSKDDEKIISSNNNTNKIIEVQGNKTNNRIENTSEKGTDDTENKTDKNSKENKLSDKILKRRKSPNAESAVIVGEPIERNWVGKLAYFVGTTIVRIFTKFELRGQENLPQDCAFLMAPNHETYVDGMLVAMGLPKKHFKRFTALVAKELEESSGLFGKVIVRVGRGIPIDRKGSTTQSLKIAINQLEKDNILLVHPEGTRSADGKIGMIKEGTCFIAKKANVPVVPIFIDGGYEIFSRHMKRPRFFNGFLKRKRLIITYGKPLYPSDYKNSREMTSALSDWLHMMYDHKEIPRVYADENLEYMEKLQKRLNRIKEKTANNINSNEKE